ncbi:Metallo-dependent phosphatase [Xylariaceae sp. FL0255]|nr:Metallo-dependent phosphatase [Xylariaceae sp. FL0255]
MAAAAQLHIGHTSAPRIEADLPKFPSINQTFGPLTFLPNGTFQISIFEDLHFGENAWDTWGPQQDINSVKVINEILDKETPGLVVLNGDLITGDNAFLQNATKVLDEIVGPLLDRDLTWASTYGNHDYQYNLSGHRILEHERKWPNARTNSMVPGDVGVSNYYLPVYDNSCTDDVASCTPELLLWFFDSRGGFKYQVLDANGSEIGNPDWVDEAVVDWFVKTNDNLVSQYEKVIPSLGFVHIPTYASYALQQIGVDPHQEPGINDDLPLAPQAQGWCQNGTNANCFYGGQDTAFMQAISQTAGMMAVFSGHDHGDTWCYKWDQPLNILNTTITPTNNVSLCFGQHSGYGGYGNWVRGSRQVLVSKEGLKNFEAESWIRLETGNIVGAVSLNMTYGQDEYPATPDNMTYCPTCIYRKR